MREVGGAVERIHHPANAALAHLRARLLGEHGVVREAPAYPIEQHALRAPVVLGHEIDASLVLRTVQSPVAFAQHGPRLARELDGRVAQRSRFGHGHAPPRAALFGQNRLYGQ